MAYIEERILPAEAGKKPKKVYRARIRIKGKPEVWVLDGIEFYKK